MTRRIVLASRSPRRQELLARILPEFDVDVADIDEDELAHGLAPKAAAEALALAKASAVGAAHPGKIVIGCDTLVVRDGVALGKPADDADAVAMIESLGGRSHQVITGVALVGGVGCSGLGSAAVRSECTQVFFRNIRREHAEAYVARGESLDKAGAYGIQGLGSLLVRRIEGCYFNVVGLPLFLLDSMLAEAGASVLWDDKERS